MAFNQLTNQCSLAMSKRVKNRDAAQAWRTAPGRKWRSRCAWRPWDQEPGDTHVLYHWYELGRAAFRPARAAADSCRLFFNPLNPLTHTPMGRSAVAACEVFERATRRYDKPEFGITHTRVGGRSVRVSEEVVWQTPFCRLVHFKRDIDPARAAQHPRLLLVAPMSGHFATLLRGTVETFLPDHEVYITDWQDARDSRCRPAASISTTTSTRWPTSSASSAATCTCSRCASRPCRCWRPPR